MLNFCEEVGPFFLFWKIKFSYAQESCTSRSSKEGLYQNSGSVARKTMEKGMKNLTENRIIENATKKP